MVNRCAMKYIDRHRAELKTAYPTFADYKQAFVVDEALLQELIQLGEQEQIKFDESEYARSKALIALQVKALIARDLFDMAQYFQIINEDNPSYLKALEIINAKETYNRLLKR